MRPENREKREAQIVNAAYALLENKGFHGVSMLGVARAAKASNETLYRWYGDKHGLFMALVARNVAEFDAQLPTIDPSASRQDNLQAFGPALLAMVLGPRAIALNRAAAGDSTGALGKALARGGRDLVRPRIVAIMSGLDDPPRMADLYLTVLLGDLQIRHVTGAMAPLSLDDIQARADWAVQIFMRLKAD